MGRKRKRAIARQQGLPKKRRYGPKSHRDQARVPKGAHYGDKVQHRKNKKASLDALSAHRYGFGLMWNVVPDLMLEAGVKPYGEYDPGNCHGVKIFGWQREVTLTEKKVNKILYEILERNVLTESQLDSVRKTLSWAWQLKVGCQKYYPQKCRNWDAVKVLYATIDYTKIPATVSSTLPTRIATWLHAFVAS